MLNGMGFPSRAFLAHERAEEHGRSQLGDRDSPEYPQPVENSNLVLPARLFNTDKFFTGKGAVEKAAPFAFAGFNPAPPPTVAARHNRPAQRLADDRPAARFQSSPAMAAVRSPSRSLAWLRISATV